MRILIASPVRQDEGIFIEYLKSLDNLIIPEGVEIDRYFILNDCENLSKYLKTNEYEILNTNDEYITNEQTHIWSSDNINKMSILRNRLIDKVLNEGYDYFFMVDSDLILNPNTLKQLLSTGKDLVSNIFWTESNPNSKEYWPNCWEYDQCTSEQESVRQWLKPGTYEVGGTGACFLISRKVLEKGVNYSPISNIKNLQGEDRFFCVRAVCNGFKIFIDTHYPATHLYRPSLYKDYMKFKYGGVYDGTHR
jgi:hypothetical protein